MKTNTTPIQIRRALCGAVTGLAVLVATGGSPALSESAAAMQKGPVEARAEWLTLLEGGWTGESNKTPLGTMPFALLFERQDDGSIRALSAFHRETWIELRIWLDEAGALRLEEAAAMEGLGEQRRQLLPSGRIGTLRRFHDALDPDFMSIDIDVRDEKLAVDVFLRGEPHVVFRLDRLPDEAIPALAEALRRQAARSPEEAGPLPLGAPSPQTADHESVTYGAEPDELAELRSEVAERPEDARARMALANALIAEISRDPSSAPRLSRELLRSLQAAHRMEPDWDAPYHGLIGYHLNAPPIAGGSLDAAGRLAGELSEIDPESGARYLELIAERTESR